MFQKIKYESVWLCNGPQDRLKDVHVNGTQTVQVAHFLRATNARPFGRGNRLLEIEFSITRAHVSLTEAQTFLFSHPFALSRQGTVIFYLYDDTVVTMGDAVVKAVSQESSGIWTSHKYSIIGASVSFSPELPTEDIMYTGTVSIPINAASVTVSGLGLSTSPQRVWGSVRKPSASGDMIWASVRDDSISSSGFIFDLSGAPGDDHHKLDFFYTL